MFSRRTRWPEAPSRLAARLDEVRLRGGLIDLAESNPTRCGFSYPWEEIGAALADPRGATYQPEPLGLPSAREAVALAISSPGRTVSPEDVVLTASTSEAYAFLFKLLCDPGDRVLSFRPGYPLLDHLAGLEEVALDQAALHREAGWALDPAEVAARLGDRTRAIAVVNPGNPTGQYLRRLELDALQALAAPRSVALISDEVFSEYPRTPAAAPEDQVRSVAGRDLPALTFALSGLSKLAGLPQLKLGWMVLGGPPAARRAALGKLELIADTYLSAGTPVQLAAPRLLALAPALRAQLSARLSTNAAALASLRPEGAAWTVLPADAGWCSVLRLPAHPGEEATCDRLLDRGVWAQPGYFFDFSGGAYLVLSLLPPPDVFLAGARAVAEVIAATG